MDKLNKETVKKTILRRAKYGYITQEEAKSILIDLDISYVDKVEFELSLYLGTRGDDQYDLVFYGKNGEAYNSKVNLANMMSNEGFYWTGGEKVKLTIERLD